MWILRALQDPEVPAIWSDDVALIQWNRDRKSPSEEDIIQNFTSENSDSEIITYRRGGGFKSLEIFFTSMFDKLVLVGGKMMTATIYDLQRDKNQGKRQGTMKSIKHLGFTRLLQIVKGDSN